VKSVGEENDKSVQEEGKGPTSVGRKARQERRLYGVPKNPEEEDSVALQGLGFGRAVTLINQFASALESALPL
jgi:hypothetical protein